jgi:hypothetical protein
MGGNCYWIWIVLCQFIEGLDDDSKNSKHVAQK